jgi:hypothetical protein
MAYRAHIARASCAPTILLLVLGACADRAPSEPPPDRQQTAFTTQFPFEYQPAPADGGSDGGGDGDAQGDGGRDPVPPGGEATNTGMPGADLSVALPDTTYVRDDLLYTLDRNAGLMITDTSDADELRLVDRYQHVGLVAIGMYVKDDVAIALYHDLDESSDEGAIEGSVVRMIDIADAAHIEPLFELAVESEIVDSRMVGDALYVIDSTHQLFAFATADRQLNRAGELSFDSEGDISLYATTERLYVAEAGAEGSTVRAIDISSGELEMAARIEVEGAIEHAGQLHEHEGVLRVVSVGSADGESQLFVDTFDAVGAQLGQAQLALEHAVVTLQVLFDGRRAFVAAGDEDTAMATLDLSDVVTPQATAALSLPGAPRALALRQERLLVLTELLSLPNSAAHLTMLDAATLATEVDRVTVVSGANAFVSSAAGRELSFLDATGVLAIPVHGPTDPCFSDAHGVQLIEVVDDELVLRGRVPAFGYGAIGVRAHRERLLVCSWRVRSYQLDDLDAPELRSEVGVVEEAPQLTIAGGKLVRMSELRLDAVAFDAATSTTLGPVFDLGLHARERGACSLSDPQLLGDAQRAYVRYENGLSDEVEVAIIDLPPSGAPQLLGTAVGWSTSEFDRPAVPLFASSPSMVVVDDVIAIEQQSLNDSGDVQGTQIEVIDTSHLESPTWITLELNGQGIGSLHAYGTRIYAGHYSLALRGDPRYAGFGLARVDITNPSGPELLTSLSVPGALLGVLDDDHIVTLDFQEDVFFVRRVSLKDERPSIASSYEVSTALQPEDFVIDGERLWMVASTAPFAEHKRDVIVLVDELDTEMPRGRQIDLDSIRELRPTEHGLLVASDDEAWLIDADGAGELEVSAELGEHGCAGPLHIAGDDALCASLGPVQRIPLAP